MLTDALAWYTWPILHAWSTGAQMIKKRAWRSPRGLTYHSCRRTAPDHGGHRGLLPDTLIVGLRPFADIELRRVG